MVKSGLRALGESRSRVFDLELFVCFLYVLQSHEAMLYDYKYKQYNNKSKINDSGDT